VISEAIGKRCELARAGGLEETCPGPACGFWDEGGCVIAALRPELCTNPELAHLLLALHRRLSETTPTHPFALVGIDP
jgi:hypothetical protein